MDILNKIPDISGSTYVGIDLTVCIGSEGGHFVVSFENEGGGYYPLLIADEKGKFPIEVKEFEKLSKWIIDTCKELDKIESKREIIKDLDNG